MISIQFELAGHIKSDLKKSAKFIGTGMAAGAGLGSVVGQISQGDPVTGAARGVLPGSVTGMLAKGVDDYRTVTGRKRKKTK